MNVNSIEKIEIDLILQTLDKRYGYDFQHYTKATIRRRVRYFLQKTPYNHVSEMIPALLYDPVFAQQMIYHFSITVTDMFRDPPFYLAVREQVVPYLKTYPFVKIWLVGCATGQEIYSLAVLLQEEDLYERVTIFATDFNDEALRVAKEGIYSLKEVQQYTANYQEAGGKRPFNTYYHAQYEHARMKTFLKERVTFANHNLVTDDVFSEVHLIFCRNVLIYFNRTLQDRVLNLLNRSLVHGGILCLGTKETLTFSDIGQHFKQFNEEMRIYQKVS